MLRYLFNSSGRQAITNAVPRNPLARRTAVGHAVACVVLLLGGSTAVHAAPYLNLWLEGRKQGSDADFTSTLDVALGDTIEYRLRVDVAPIETTNSDPRLKGPPWHPGVHNEVITELIPGRDGVNSLSVLELVQSPEDGIQTHFTAPAALIGDSSPGHGEGWDAKPSARGGVPTLRAGSVWNDLASIRPAHGPGVFTALDPETAFTGTFSIAQVTGPLSQLNGRATNIFGMKINGRQIFPVPNNEATVDPIYAISPLNLTTHFDVGADQVIVNYLDDSHSPEGTIREQIIAGRGGPGVGNGTWTGRGITSSAAATANAQSPETYSVGYADQTPTTVGSLVAAGEPNNTSIAIRFTRTGDANLDGLVNEDDVAIVSANYAPGVPQPHWALGDFDYNGFVDDADVTLLGVFYDPLAAPLVSGGRVSGEGVAAVPEPSGVALAVLAMLMAGVCFGRRRRR